MWSLDSIDDIIESGEATLQEILMEDNILFDIMTEESDIVLDYFSLPEVVQELFDIALGDSSQFQYISIEVIIKSGYELSNVFVEHPSFSRLFKIIMEEDDNEKLNVAAKIVLNFLKKDSSKVLEHMTRNKGFVDVLFSKINNSSVFELINSLMLSLNIGVQSWLVQNNFLEILMGKFNPSNTENLFYQCSTLVMNLVNFNSNIDIKLEFFSSDYFQSMFDYLINSENYELCYIILDILTEITHIRISSSNNVLKHAFEHLEDLKVILLREREKCSTSNGKLESFGLKKYNVLQFICSLIINNNQFDEIVISSGIIKLIVDIFFKFNWNNFVHNTVRDFISEIFETDRKLLIENLFVECKLPERILETQGKPSQPYSGHLFQITSKIQDLKDVNITIKKNLDNLPSWSEYIKTTYLPLYIKQSQKLGENSESSDELDISFSFSDDGELNSIIDQALGDLSEFSFDD
eukprot:TRINITY_DN12849_c0_g1_i1.p1 TRINITY_DN12849_c0_g1~~TRINITY_DN12849_c0_g1_i1.p1  ORF type:complete len:466 (+),score=97.72 TRINITY_DN12849_c0_g1_i1:37-1434(+)